MVKVAVIQFPGSNCDLDALEILQKTIKVPTDLVWHKDLKQDQYDAYVIPGGFSYGDYLRAGAIAATSPGIQTIREAAEEGKPVLGICNGFQILVEAGILPGAVLRNAGLRFVCKWTRLRIESTRTPFTNLASKGQILRIPIAHNEVLRYVDDCNVPTEDSNPNGSMDNIAGIGNRKGNVMGLMPHPERASLPILSLDHHVEGRLIFDSMISALEKTAGQSGTL